MRSRFGAIAVRAASWGVGVALGVALGAYLTAVSGSGAPGATALDASELIVLPAIAGTAVFAVLFVVGVGVSHVAGVLHARSPHGGDDDDERDEGDAIAG